MIYYASPTGLATNDGSIGSPWSLQKALINDAQTSGDILYLRDGTYLGKYQSTLDGGTVLPYPGETPIIDGYYTTTLNGAIDASQTSFALTSAVEILAGSPGVTSIWIDDEIIHTYGKSGNTITQAIRGYGGTTAASHANGATVKLVGNQLEVWGTNTTYQNFEITTSLPNRTGIYQIQRGSGVVEIGTGNSFINLISHDNVVGIFTGSATNNTLIYGCLLYNNGVVSDIAYGGTEPRGLNLYLENTSGYSRVWEVLELNSFVNGGQYFGQTASYVGGDTKGSVFANAGAPVRNVYPSSYYRQLIVGTNSVEIPSVSIDHSYFWQPNLGTAINLAFGYGAGIASGSVTNSVIVGTIMGCEFSPTTGTFTNNIVDVNYGAGSVTLKSVGLSNTIDNNLYYHVDGVSGWFYYGAPGHSTVSFTQWKIDSGYDSSSTASASAMPDTVYVRPNDYQIGRAHIIVYAQSAPTSINVDLATTGLTDGQDYTIKNAFDYFGTAVATGTYDAGSTTISLPLNGAATNVATPTGLAYTAPTTAPNFAAFVVVPGTAASGTPGTPTGLTANVGQSSGATGTMQLAWTLGSGTETSVTVRRIVGGVTTDIPLSADTTSYTDTGQTVGLPYTYAVKASNAAGDSAWSDTAQEVLTGLTCFGAPPSIG